MAVEAQDCPKCGASIQFSEGQAEAVCAYCGTTVVKAEGPAEGVVSIDKEIENEKQLQETTERETRLHSGGRPATAKILSAQKSDIIKSMLNGKGMLISFTVEVQPDGEAPFSVGTKAIVGLVALDKYQPGTLLDVRYDPQDHTQVSVEGRHAVPESNPWTPFQQADEQIRQGEEEYQKGMEEFEQAEKEMEQADEEMKKADEAYDRLTSKRKK